MLLIDNFLLIYEKVCKGFSKEIIISTVFGITQDERHQLELVYLKCMVDIDLVQKPAVNVFGNLVGALENDARK